MPLCAQALTPISEVSCLVHHFEAVSAWPWPLSVRLVAREILVQCAQEKEVKGSIGCRGSWGTRVCCLPRAVSLHNHMWAVCIPRISGDERRRKVIPGGSKL